MLAVKFSVLTFERNKEVSVLPRHQFTSKLFILEDIYFDYVPMYLSRTESLTTLAKNVKDY